MAESGQSWNGANDWPASCVDFSDFWLRLRGDALMPTTEQSFDTMPPHLAPSIYIIEVTEDASIVRFQGTELVRNWGFDVTGLDVCTHRSNRLRRLVHQMMSEIVRQPCGYFCRSVYSSAMGQRVTADIVRFPLAVKDGRPPRIINFKHEDTVLDQMDTSWVSYQNTQQDWLDIGAGLPAEPPIELIE